MSALWSGIPSYIDYIKSVVLLRSPFRAGSAAMIKRLLRETVFIFLPLAELPSKPFMEPLFLLEDDYSRCGPPVVVTF
jgi:hypothetical protein